MSVNKFVLNETSYFGKGAREELPEEIRKRGFKKVLVVTDKALAECGVINKVTDVLEKAGIPFEVYSEVKPNPTIKNVLDGVQACKNAGADVIVAVGGGSSIDTAKGISIIMTNPDRDDVRSLNGLSNKEHDIIILCYGFTGQEYTPELISPLFGCTPERIRQIRKEAIKKLRKRKILKDI